MAELRKLEPTEPSSPPPLYRTGFPEDGTLSAPTEEEQAARLEAQKAELNAEAEREPEEKEGAWKRFKRFCGRKWQGVKNFFSGKNSEE